MISSIEILSKHFYCYYTSKNSRSQEMKGIKHMKTVANEQISERQIKKLQEELRMNKSLLGFYFWTELIKEALKVNLITEITIGNLLQKVAKKFNTTPSKVDKGLRVSINSTGVENIQKFFNASYKITIKSMLFLCLDYLKEQYNIK